MIRTHQLSAVRSVPSVREQVSWDSVQVREWAEEACRLVRTRPFNIRLRRTGRMLDYGALETASPVGTPVPVVWAVYQFDEPMPPKFPGDRPFSGDKPVVGLAIAYCPPAQAWDIWPLYTFDPAEIPQRPFSHGGMALLPSVPRPLGYVLDRVLMTAEEGYCSVCHTYIPPINPFARLEESIFGAAQPCYPCTGSACICANCGKNLGEPE